MELLFGNFRNCRSVYSGITVRFGPEYAASGKADDFGFVTNELLDYYQEKTDGGHIGLVIVEHAFIRQDGKASHRQLSIACDHTFEGLSKLASLIKSNGSRAVLQANHAGNKASPVITDSITVTPWMDDNQAKDLAFHQLSESDIDDLICNFTDAARRAKEAGFDGIEIHSAHGYLLNQFYSPLTNKRKDSFGGTLLNRIRIHARIIKNIREELGPAFAILLRLGASDYRKGGTTIEHSIAAAKALNDSGLDILDISGGISGYNIPELSGQGFFAPLTTAIKQKVNIPLILTGGITDASFANELISSGKTDLVGVGRAILNDSNWARNALQSDNFTK